MKFRTKILIDSVEALNGLSNKEFEPKVAYKIAKVINKIKPEMDAYDKVKNDLIKKYGKKKDGTGPVGIDRQGNPEGYDNFIKDLELLQDEDVEIVFNTSGADITKIRMDQLTDSTGMQIDIPPIWLTPLMGWLLEDEEEI